MFITNQLRDEIGELNKSKGWYSEPRSIAQHCILLHSEVSEIVEDYRNNQAINKVWYEYKNDDGSVDKVSGFIRNGVLGKPCGIPSELADVVIRALDMAYEYEIDVTFNPFSDELLEFNHQNKSNEFMMALLHDDINDLFFYEVHESEFNNIYIQSVLHDLITLCEYIAGLWNINLEQQILDKLAYNRTRPARHGNKRL